MRSLRRMPPTTQGIRRSGVGRSTGLSKRLAADVANGRGSDTCDNSSALVRFICSRSPEMRIAEIFRSLQGEGFLTGTPSLFVRTSGCKLRCWYCDTPYTSCVPEGDDRSVDEILQRADGLVGKNGQVACRHAVLTCG